ncbi:unnamed protein product [Oikopleura dioica]|uniref:Uncharacterized protein n=1 Tax=Oikopleura dioica TaxID=34765 RepID=E4XVK3_OIKDI|nr:unnamed protein product [Oikopleura dioica]
MRQSDGLWSSGIGKASLRFFCFKNASEIQLIDLDESLITADALLTVLDNLLESNPDEIDLEEVVVQAASDFTEAPKSSTKTTKTQTTDSSRILSTIRNESRISVTSSTKTKKLMTTTVAEKTDSILKNPVSETTSSPDMIFDTTFVAEELTTNSKIESEDDLLPAFLQPTTQEETSTVLTVVQTRDESKSGVLKITFSILCFIILLFL